MSATSVVSVTREATHVAFDTHTTERLTALGMTVVRASDILIIGPSRRNVLEHARARKAWWGPPPPPQEPEEWDRLYAPEIRWAAPVVVWVSASPTDILNLWRTCSWLRDRGLSERDALIIELEPAPRRPGAVPRHEPFECNESLTDYPDEVLLERLARARPWPRARFSRVVDLWRRFVQANPLGFARRSAREAPNVWALFSSLFPRLTPSGLRLSRFDELLLNVLSPEEWKTAVRVYVHDDAEWRALLCCTGDVWLPGQLDRWVNHGPSSAVERAAGPRPDNPMLSPVYRLTERGVRLRAGLDQLADAPPLPVGRTEAYGAPWVLREDARLVRL